MIRDLGTSLVTQAIIVLGNLAVLRLAAERMDPEEVGELALVRRVLALLAPALLLGLGIGLPRCLGRARPEDPYRDALVTVGGFLSVVMALAACAVLLLFPQSMASLLFGDARHAYLVRPLALIIVGHQSFLLVYAVLRGRLQIRRANGLHIAQIALIPVVAVLAVGRQGVEMTLFYWGIAAVVIGGVAIVALLGRAVARSPWKRNGIAWRELLRYGLPRVPGDFAFMGLYVLGPLVAAHALDIRAAGLLAIGMSLVTVLSAAFTPVGLVLLPRMSRTLADGGDDALRQRLPMLLGAACYGSAFLVAFGANFGNDWLGWILGPEFVFDHTAIVLLAAAAGGNVVFVVLRSVLDAAYVRPLNAVHATIALVAQYAAWKMFFAIRPEMPFIGVCGATAVSFLLLGALTVAASARRFRLRVGATTLLRWLAVQAIVVAAGFGFGALLENRNVALMALSQLIFVAVWLLTLRGFGTPWFAEIVDSLARYTRRGSTIAVPAPAPSQGGRL